jgi:hypothetical protein
MGQADEAGAGSYALPQRQASFRFRDDTASLLRRARGPSRNGIGSSRKAAPRNSSPESAEIFPRLTTRYCKPSWPCFKTKSAPRGRPCPPAEPR